MASQSPMHFNININLDKKKGVVRGASGTPSGETVREASKSGGGFGAHSSVPAYNSAGFFGGMQPVMHDSYGSQQQQYQLRELYSKFSLYQQKQVDTEAALAEAKTSLLKKTEEVIGRDQIISVLTHTVKMKDQELEYKNEEIRRLREDLDSVRRMQVQPVQPTQPQSMPSNDVQRDSEVENLKAMIRDMQASMNQDLAVRDRVINDQLGVMKEMMKKLGASSQPPPTPVPSIPVRHSRPPSVPCSVGVTPRSAAPQYEPLEQHLSSMTPVLQPSDRANTATEIPNQEIAIDKLMIFNDPPAARARSATPQSIVMSEEQFSAAVSKKGSIASLAAEITARLPEQRNSVSSVAPAAKPNTAIAMPCDEISLDNLNTPVRSRQGSQASAAGLVRHASRASSALTPAAPPAEKRNTAIELPGQEVEVGSQF